MKLNKPECALGDLDPAGRGLQRHEPGEGAAGTLGRLPPGKSERGRC